MNKKWCQHTYTQYTNMSTPPSPNKNRLLIPVILHPKEGSSTAWSSVQDKHWSIMQVTALTSLKDFVGHSFRQTLSLSIYLLNKIIKFNYWNKNEKVLYHHQFNILLYYYYHLRMVPIRYLRIHIHRLDRFTFLCDYTCFILSEGDLFL